ncbi:hypothetical protein L596_000444 [Steinernema carpocapsae]|uniref:Skp1-related protein n=1 Tax=Steinernema carpocapsae TaxID=34508 RepID=A0A4U8UKH3_STECR|nr:hypothetical protein L596_000444 [Steinernema carpocapsae]
MDTEMAPEPEVFHTLTSKEGDEFQISAKALRQSIMLSTMLDDLNGDDDSKPATIPVDSISSEYLKKIVDWCEHHKEDAKPEKEPDMPNGVRPPPPKFDIPEWDKAYLTVDETDMYYLLIGVNFLEIPWLYRYLLKMVYCFS